ncbi:hypothetical protein [Aurantimonas coralicida]|uniref:hypothetical protein n=1 Tax=Aurantimonas coralicida TaxID=182270 RepID=UPI0023865EBF|nr:hypothetical protein [Aurantimonas coralicida]MDE0924490.1 hypothetical protein [Aurantimonas coralicida]
MPPSFDRPASQIRLEAAARSYVAARRRVAADRAARRQLAALLRPFAPPSSALDAAVAADDPGLIPEGQRQEMLSRLAAELRHLARLARRGDRAYDINRHLKAKRLARWLGRAERWLRSPAPPGSGRSANARFRHAGRCRSMP